VSRPGAVTAIGAVMAWARCSDGEPQVLHAEAGRRRAGAGRMALAVSDTRQVGLAPRPQRILGVPGRMARPPGRNPGNLGPARRGIR
jgi:hypothetical protein